MTYPYTSNNENILILGDPGLSPAQPRLPLSLNVTDTIGFQGKRLVTVTGTVIGGFAGTALVTVFDSDVPGRKAAERAMQWSNVRSVCLGWKDPDAGLKYLNFDKFKKHVQKKISEITCFL